MVARVRRGAAAVVLVAAALTWVIACAVGAIALVVMTYLGDGVPHELG